MAAEANFHRWKFAQSHYLTVRRVNPPRDAGCWLPVSGVNSLRPPRSPPPSALPARPTHARPAARLPAAQCGSAGRAVRSRASEPRPDPSRTTTQKLEKKKSTRLELLRFAELRWLDRLRCERLRVVRNTQFCGWILLWLCTERRWCVNFLQVRPPEFFWIFPALWWYRSILRSLSLPQHPRSSRLAVRYVKFFCVHN